MVKFYCFRQKVVKIGPKVGLQQENCIFSFRTSAFSCRWPKNFFECKEGFTAEVKRVVWDLGDVRTDSKKPRDPRPRPSCYRKRDENRVEEGSNPEQKEQLDSEVKVLNPNQRGLKLAMIVLSEKEAGKLEEVSHLKVRMTNCRVRRRVIVTRFFWCLDFGHLRCNCKGEDRSSLCCKSGKAGHLATSCTETQKCLLCVIEALTVNCGHVARSGSCAVFRCALEAQKKKEMWKPAKKNKKTACLKGRRGRPQSRANSVPGWEYFFRDGMWMVQLLAGQLASLIKKRKPKRKFRQRGIKKLSIITAAKKKMKCVITSREVIKSSILTARVAVK